MVVHPENKTLMQLSDMSSEIPKFDALYLSDLNKLFSSESKGEDNSVMLKDLEQKLYLMTQKKNSLELKVSNLLDENCTMKEKLRQSQVKDLSTYERNIINTSIDTVVEQDNSYFTEKQFQ